MSQRPLARAVVAGVGSVLALGCLCPLRARRARIVRGGVRGRPRRAHGHRPRAATAPEPDRASRRRAGAGRPGGNAAGPDTRVGAGRDRRRALLLPAASRSIPRGWAWATSSSPSCSEPHSAWSVALALLIACFAVAFAGIVLIVRHGCRGAQAGGAVWPIPCRRCGDRPLCGRRAPELSSAGEGPGRSVRHHPGHQQKSGVIHRDGIARARAAAGRARAVTENGRTGARETIAS